MVTDGDRDRDRKRRDREREDGRDEHPRSWVPRVLAPLAFFAAATLLVLIVHNSLNSDAGTSATPPPAAPGATGATTTNPTTTNRPPGQRRFYRIRDGDTLDQIALRFDTTVEELLTLNPGVEANALTPGQRIRIR